jgi:hypothetical protein
MNSVFVGIIYLFGSVAVYLARGAGRFLDASQKTWSV